MLLHVKLFHDMLAAMEQHETPRHAASKAVIALRKALGMTQQELAVKVLKTAITTVARWETSHPPHGDALLKLADIAGRKGLFDIQYRFRGLYLQEVYEKNGSTPYTGFPENEAWVFTQVKGQQERELAMKFLDELFAMRKAGR
jgi:transcriptional regulator with XRE-family HTH domain